MRHHIDTNTLGPNGASMARAVSTCVHCGFCLPACPTYRVLGEEMDSPRGRILLMKSVLEGELPLEEALPHVDRCLGCLACVTACPSGVEYGELLTPFRARAEAARHQSIGDWMRRQALMRTLPYPGRFRLAARAGQLARRARGLVPKPFHAMLDLVPQQLPAARPLPELYPAVGTRRARVALLAGCAQQVLAPEIGWAALRVLSQCGVEVIVPKAQGCCGSIAMHVGEEALARDLARKNLRAFPDDVDAIVTTTAGCGSGMREYELLFRGTPDEAAAVRFASRVTDICAFLDAQNLVAELRPLRLTSSIPALPHDAAAGGTRTDTRRPAPSPGEHGDPRSRADSRAAAAGQAAASGSAPAPPAASDTPLRVAYHDACHLAHGQGVRQAPRALLQRIPNVTLVDIADAGDCCGSAGTYNIDQPDIARRLGARKAAAIRATGADIVASGNIGCLTQIRTHLRDDGVTMPVLHTIELLDRALGGGTDERG